jgi:putative transposase
MSQYRRFYVPGGVFFLTLVTYHRIPLFSEVENISRLRKAIAKMRQEKPFDITAAVVLPDHLHFIWMLPANDSDYSQRVSRLKVLFTRSCDRTVSSASCSYLSPGSPTVKFVWTAGVSSCS